MKKQEKIKLIKDNLTNYQVIENYSLYTGCYDEDCPSDYYQKYEGLTEELNRLKYFLHRNADRITEQINAIEKKLNKLEQLKETGDYDYYIETPNNELKGLTEKQAADYCLNMPYNADYLNMIIEDYDLK